jgi:two-component system sensor histidine kinase KdpD
VLINYFFTAPVHTFSIAERNNLIALIIFLAVASMVSSVVDLAARRTRIAARASAEAETLSVLAGSVLRGEQALPALLDRLRETFGMTSVTLLRRSGGASLDVQHDDRLWTVVATAGTQPCLVPAEADIEVPVGDDAMLALRGRTLPAADRRVLAAFAAQATVALEQRRLSREAEEARPLAEADRARTALLNAVSHDLRTPLASAKAAIGSLLSSDVAWTDGERAELLATADESLDKLTRLVENLLDMSRLESGALSTFVQPVALDEVVPRALDDLGPEAREVEVRDLDFVPPVAADAALMERVVANLVSNALRYSPPDSPPIVTASVLDDQVELRIVDRGPGIPDDDRERVFRPFQRLGDRDNSTGVGLGLALSRGLVEAMHGTLEIEDTPGGGLTMVVTLRAAGPDPVHPVPAPQDGTAW